MATEITRHIKQEVERELWARAAGRCEFNGCNRLLYKSPITQETVNLAEKAHIYSYSKNGPRGWGPFVTNRKELNNIGNLMLVCHGCHETIDQDEKGEQYSAELLNKWKEQHEKRMVIVTGVHQSKQSHVVLYGADIGLLTSKLQPEPAKAALFPDWYPAEERPLLLSLDGLEKRDNDPDFWKIQADNLKASFERQVRPLIDGAAYAHWSLFGLAPMPLLTLFGSLFTDKISAQVYQLHREPMTWNWLDGHADLVFRVVQPRTFENPPVLVISLSDHIAADRVTSVLGDVSIWELTVDRPNNDFLKSKAQLSRFRETVRQLIVDIGVKHGKATPLAIFPAMPVACAIELGRVRMPKADSKWIIYDQCNAQRKFIYALEIGGT